MRFTKKQKRDMRVASVKYFIDFRDKLQGEENGVKIEEIAEYVLTFLNIDKEYGLDNHLFMNWFKSRLCQKIFSNVLNPKSIKFIPSLSYEIIGNSGLYFYPVTHEETIRCKETQAMRLRGRKIRNEQRKLQLKNIEQNLIGFIKSK